MAISDQIVECISLRKSVRWWRGFSIVGFFALLVLLFGSVNVGLNTSKRAGSCVARFDLDGMIRYDRAVLEKLRRIEDADNIKALIFGINSPGGTIVGSEALYNSLRRIANKKPVVALMGDLATSGGYMVAIASDHVIAHNGTITGSIGVLAQYVGVVGLANKLGITLKSVKSSDLKAAFSPLEELSEKSESAMHDVIMSGYDYFVSLVKDRRDLSDTQVSYVTDGRVFTGVQALKLKLVDEVGDYNSALSWLKNEKAISTDCIKDFGIDNGRRGIFRMFSSVSTLNMLVKKVFGGESSGIANGELERSGLMVVW